MAQSLGKAADVQEDGKTKAGLAKKKASTEQAASEDVEESTE